MSHPSDRGLTLAQRRKQRRRTTQEGRIVYDRATHYFKNSDVIRIMKAILKSQDKASQAVDAKNFMLLWGILLEFVLYSIRNMLKFEVFTLAELYIRGFGLISQAVDMIGNAFGITTYEIQTAIGKLREQTLDSLEGR